jgi:UDPglucose--hexose-1-phosphate uridylyltransferase
VIRFHPITGEPLILAPGRAERPNAFAEGCAEEHGQATHSPAADAADCPFCPDHEQETPPEIARIGEPWRLRVFSNKYPATDGHEVVVESPRHDAAFHEIQPADAEEAVRLYAQRYRVLRETARCVTIFKNHGARAGASIPHIHSQILGTPFVTPRVARESDGFTRAPECPLCPLPGMLIDGNDSFAWIAPHGSTLPYQSWIVPRVHAPELVPLTAVAELAPLLQRASSSALKVAPAFNWIFLNFPGTPRAHWYIEVLPRATNLAGFELGSGSAINIIDPESAARALSSR